MNVLEQCLMCSKPRMNVGFDGIHDEDVKDNKIQQGCGEQELHS